MNVDIVQKNRDLRRYGQKTSFDGFFWAAFLMLCAAVTLIYNKEASSGQSDIYLHGMIATGFSYRDLHSITSRIAYPFWHLNFSVLYKLGMPLVPAAAIVCIVYKMLGFLLVQRIIALYIAPDVSTKAATLAALAAMFVTAVRIPGVNPTVYIGIGSPNVWHNPTQIVAVLSSLLCVFYTAHIAYGFLEAIRTPGGRALLPWKKVVALAVILLFAAVCKPTFLQAYLPACAVFFAVLWVRNPKHSRYFLQVILAFLPAALYFLMQYLYYTGVVVPFTSGVAVDVSLERIWTSVRNMAMMAAFPLFVLFTTARKEDYREPVLLLTLLVAGVSILEAAVFYETGMRENHGNFSWASMNAAFLLWVIVLPRFIREISRYRADRQRLSEDAKRGAVHSGELARAAKRLNLRSAGLLAAVFLLLWHLYSAMYYLYYLFSTGSVF